jgi:hypothetical protein
MSMAGEKSKPGESFGGNSFAEHSREKSGLYNKECE